MKQFTSWGFYSTVETKKGTFDNVIICPCPTDKNVHLLEASNGDVTTINTKELLTITTKVNENVYTTNC